MIDEKCSGLKSCVISAKSDYQSNRTILKMLALSLSLLTMSMASGCASISRGSMQQVHVNAYDSKTNNIVAADCFLSNDEGIVYTKSNKSTLVGRDKDPMTVHCHTDALAGKTVVDGQVNGGYVIADFFLVDFCILSCWVDGLSGAWAEYPAMPDVALGLKDDSYRNILKEKHIELKQQVTEGLKQSEAFSNSLADEKSPNHATALELKKKYEESQVALKVLDAELASR